VRTIAWMPVASLLHAAPGELVVVSTDVSPGAPSSVTVAVCGCAFRPVRQ